MKKPEPLPYIKPLRRPGSQTEPMKIVDVLSRVQLADNVHYIRGLIACAELAVRGSEADEEEISAINWVLLTAQEALDEVAAQILAVKDARVE